jgi:hypothetical protein
VTAVELILAALVAGASAGLTNTTSGAIGDAYAALRSLLAGRLAGLRAAVEAIDARRPEPGTWQDRLSDELIRSGAAADEEILAAAQRLLRLVDPEGVTAGKYRVDLREARGVQVGDHNTQHNTFN